MNQEDWERVQACQLSPEQYKNQSVDFKRESIVPTYTLDLLFESMEGLGVHNKSLDHIFILKVDTEGHDDRVLLGAAHLLQQKQIDFVIFETSRNHLLKTSVEFMSWTGYECYLIYPNFLVPLHVQHWWPNHLDTFTGFWWGNAVCGIEGSPKMKMLWRMYHSDNVRMANAYELLYNSTGPERRTYTAAQTAAIGGAST